ncbi:Mu transposase domain-containing protein [Holdemanella porci]|uniref:Mu transposase domain-containing protein n=1 Tax=Holdemanella porci TaxID=2652276 RepID=UPI003CC8D937
MFEYDHHYYSVPYTYYKQEVTLKASYFDIIICDSMNHLVCTHKRAHKPFPKYITKEEHMPESHLYYYLENKMNAEAYKSWARSYYPNVYEFICKVIGTLRYEAQSYKSFIRAVMEFFICVKKSKSIFRYSCQNLSGIAYLYLYRF